MDQPDNGTRDGTPQPGTPEPSGTPEPAAPPIDSGAVLWSASETDRVGRPLLLILHGYGSHEGDLFSLAPHLPLTPVLAALRAPLPVGDGWAWFPIGVPGANVNPSAPAASAIEAATDAVLAWLDALVVPPASVGLLGFSQGGAMALQLLRQAPDRFTFAVELSGFVAAAPQPGDADLAERPVPVFWGRGTADPVIQADAVGRTQDWLPGHSLLTERIYEGMGHSISQGELSDIVGFLRAQYADSDADAAAGTAEGSPA